MQQCPHPLAFFMACTSLVSCCMRLQALHHLVREGLLDEAREGEIGNLLVVELCQYPPMRDLQVLRVNEKLDDLLELRLDWQNLTSP